MLKALIFKHLKSILGRTLQACIISNIFFTKKKHYMYIQDIDTSLVKLLAEEKSNSLIPYIENHELYLAFEETKAALEKYSVSIIILHDVP